MIQQYCCQEKLEAGHSLGVMDYLLTYILTFRVIECLV